MLMYMCVSAPIVLVTLGNLLKTVCKTNVHVYAVDEDAEHSTASCFHGTECYQSFIDIGLCYLVSCFSILILIICCSDKLYVLRLLNCL